MDAVKVEIDLPESMVFKSPGDATIIRVYDIVKDRFVMIAFKDGRYAYVRHVPEDHEAYADLIERLDAYLDSENWPLGPNG
jgi:hypothetical protein